MFRASAKYPFLQYVRMSAARRSVFPGKEFRLSQSSFAGHGGRGRGGFWLLFGSLTAGTVGTAVYAKYDPDFKKLVEDNVPYSGSFLNTTSDLLDSVTGFFGSTPEKPADKLPPPSLPISVVKPKPLKAEETKAKADPAAATPPAPKKPVAEKKEPPKPISDKNLNTLAITLDASMQDVSSTFSNAAQHLKALGEELSRNLNSNPNDKALADMLSKNLESGRLTSIAQASGASIRAQVHALKKVLDESKLPENSDDKAFAKKIIAQSEKQLKDAEAELQQAHDDILKFNALQEKLTITFSRLERELGPGWLDGKREGIELTQAWTRTMMLIALRMMHYKEQLAKRLDEAAKTGGGETSEDVQSQLSAKEEELRIRLDQEYEREMMHLQEECERRLQAQLQVQASTLAKEKAAALLTQRASFVRELSDRMGQQQAQYAQQLKAAAHVLKSADENLAQRLQQIQHGAKLLAISRSCDKLASSFNTNPLPGQDWSHQKCLLAGHVKDVKEAFMGQEDDFVNLTLGMLPETVINQGVYTETALRARFNGVERLARKVSMIKEAENVSLSKYVLSYLRSMFLSYPVSHISSAELTNQPVDFANMDNDAILDRAKYFMDQGDLEQAVRYMNLLQGPSLYVASGWLEDTQRLLMVRHVVHTLSAYATLLVQQGIESADKIAPSTTAPK